MIWLWWSPAEHPKCLMDNLCWLPDAAAVVAVRRGLRINWDAGKTEAIIKLQGQGKQEAMESLRVSESQSSILGMPPFSQLQQHE